VWVGALVGAVLIALCSAPEQRVKWIALTMATCTVAAFSVQLGLRRKDGFVDRVGASVAGALVLLAGTTTVFCFVGPGLW